MEISPGTLTTAARAAAPEACGGTLAQQLLAKVVRLHRWTDHGWNVPAQELHGFRDLVGAQQAYDGATTQLRDTALRYIDRNLDRVNLRLRDGAPSFVDYAELGRAFSASELLARLQPGAGELAVPGSGAPVRW